jgi:putative NADH-flavin reductase
MKIVLIGANGTIGELLQKALAGPGHEIVKVGPKSGEFLQSDRYTAPALDVLLPYLSNAKL